MNLSKEQKKERIKEILAGGNGFSDDETTIPIGKYQGRFLCDKSVELEYLVWFRENVRNAKPKFMQSLGKEITKRKSIRNL